MILLAVLLGLLPSFAWLFFYLHEDLHPEPKRLIALTFMGGMGSALVALAIETNIQDALKAHAIAVLSPLGLFLFAIVEEIVKFGTAYLLIADNPEFDEPIDAMIYTVTTALGFAAVENLGITLIRDNSLFIGETFSIISLRFLGATLLHSLASALVGYAWAKGMAKPFLKEELMLLGGLSIAIALHTLFNYLILHYESQVYAILLLLIVGFFVLTDFEDLRGEPSEQSQKI